MFSTLSVSKSLLSVLYISLGLLGSVLLSSASFCFLPADPRIKTFSSAQLLPSVSFFVYDITSCIIGSCGANKLNKLVKKACSIVGRQWQRRGWEEGWKLAWTTPFILSMPSWRCSEAHSATDSFSKVLQSAWGALSYHQPPDCTHSSQYLPLIRQRLSLLFNTRNIACLYIV